MGSNGRSKTKVFHSAFIIPHSSFRGRDGVHPAGMPGTAAQDAPDGEPGSLERPVHVDRLARVGGAGRVETALASEEGSKQQPVTVYQEQQHGPHSRGV